MSLVLNGNLKLLLYHHPKVCQRSREDEEDERGATGSPSQTAKLVSSPAMDNVSLTLALSPHGHLVLSHEEGAPSLDAALARRLRDAFDRGPGHGLLQLGADEAGTALPPVYSYWREFGARYVTSLCTQQPDGEASRQRASVA